VPSAISVPIGTDSRDVLATGSLLLPRNERPHRTTWIEQGVHQPTKSPRVRLTRTSSCEANRLGREVPANGKQKGKAKSTSTGRPRHEHAHFLSVLARRPVHTRLTLQYRGFIHNVAVERSSLRGACKCPCTENSPPLMLDLPGCRCLGSNRWRVSCTETEDNSYDGTLVLQGHVAAVSGP